jgi:hypothetical protein
MRRYNKKTKQYHEMEIKRTTKWSAIKTRRGLNLSRKGEFLKCDICIKIKNKLKEKLDAVTRARLCKQYGGHNQEQREQRLKFWKHNDKAW